MNPLDPRLSPTAPAVDSDTVQQPAAKPAPAATGAAAAAEPTDVLGIVGMSPNQLKALAAGKPRAAHATLATPPPLPPNAPKITDKTVKVFTQFHAEIGEAMGRGENKNAPSVKALLAQARTSDLSTTAGMQQATQATAQAAHSAISSFSSASAGGGLTAFLILTVQAMDKNKDNDSKMIDTISKAQLNSIQQQQQQRAAQSAALKKAQAKAKALGPLKIFVMIFAAVAAVLTGGLAMTLIGATAGFLIGGFVGGKQKGNGFDIMSAVQGAVMGGGIGSMGALLGNVLKSIMTGLSKGLTSIGAQSLGKGVQSVTTTLEKGVLKGLDGLSATAKSTVPNAVKNAKFVKAVSAKVSPLSQDARIAMARASLMVGGAATDIVAAGVQLKVDLLTNDAKKAEAQAKMQSFILETLNAEYDRISDSVQSVQTYYKTTTDSAVDMVKNHGTAMNNAISGIIG